MIKAVVFDLDDTLAPELLYVKSGYAAVAKKIAEDAGAIMSFMGMFRSLTEDVIATKLWELFTIDHKNVFNRFFDELNVVYDASDVMNLVKIYREHMPDSTIYRMYDDVNDAITTLRGNGIRLGIISDGFSVAQRNKASALKLDTLFNSMIFTQELGEGCSKPSRVPFDEMAKMLGVELHEMVYVGDNPEKDFYIKKECPEITTVRVLRIKGENGCIYEGVYDTAEYREDVREDIRINDLQGLWKAIS